MLVNFKLLFFPIIIGLLITFTSCSFHRLSVQTQYLSRDDLASFHVGTPDPRLDNPIIGERLLIQWSLSSNDLICRDVYLSLKTRFRNHQEDEVTIPIDRKNGTYLYYLTNERYCETGGIQTYRAEIRTDDCILAQWKHPLWKELIVLDVPDKKNKLSNVDACKN